MGYISRKGIVNKNLSNKFVGGKRAVWKQLPRAYYAFGNFIWHNFLMCVRRLTHYRLDVCCPSVRLSVTRWYCVETAQPIVTSSLPGSPIILVLRGPKFSQEFQWEHPNTGVKCKGQEKVAISDQYLAIARING